MSKDKLQFLSPLFLKYQSEFEKNPRSRVFAPLAESYRKVGMTDKALDILSQGIRYNPGYTMGYVGLAFCYFDMKQYNLAYSTLRALIETNRDNLRLQKLFSDICLKLEKKEEALETLKYLLFVNPRDKEVAEFVFILEKELDEKFKPTHNPIIIPAEHFQDERTSKVSSLFDVDKLESNPKIDFDDWLAVDINAQNKKENTKTTSDLSTGWNIEKSHVIFPDEVESEKHDSINLEFKEDYNSEIEIEKIDETPIVTHTLVDLYCGQGHIEKAIEVLEKILLLNPNDIRTKEKLSEIKLLMEPFDKSNELDSESEYISEQVKTHKPDNLVSLDELENTSEEDGRRALMDILDQNFNTAEAIPSNLLHIAPVSGEKDKRIAIEHKLNQFLIKIKKRALDYQNRV